MTNCRVRLACLLAALFALPAAAEDLPPIPPIKRVLPPEGIEIPADVRQRLEERIKRVDQSVRDFCEGDEAADILIFTKAVKLALLHREFYTPKDFEKAEWALAEAEKRLKHIRESGGAEPPWKRQRGLVLRGYESDLDESAQPVGIVIPDDYDFAKPGPVYVWLHGRGDKQSDLHFLYERATKIGQIAPKGSIVIHPFGRHCVGFKHAGERDVLDAVDRMTMEYDVAIEPFILMGFSMGGAGAWHIGAHYPLQWEVVSPGAGFAETSRYQNLATDKFPPEYEQTLWGQYDVPNYVRNLFNLEVIAYSGELDKQIQAARVMEEAYAAEGKKLTHLIGPGVEHKYEPATLAELLQRIDRRVKAPGNSLEPIRTTFQTRTLRYNEGVGGAHNLEVTELEEHWRDSRVDFEEVGLRSYRLITKNVARLHFYGSDEDLRGTRLQLDGTVVEIKSDRSAAVKTSFGLSSAEAFVVKKDGKWQEDEEADTSLRKRPGLQGPIDDAFMETFTVVVPTGKSRNSRFQQWCEFELEHFLARWRALMRGEPKIIKDVDAFIGPDDSIKGADGNMILWGDPDSNVAIKQVLKSLPVKFADGSWQFGGVTYDGNQFTPALIYPDQAGRLANYIVLNSGLTFREGHDRTNSLQNPKLPDWAIIDITQPPDAFAPGRIHDAGFFDEKWQLKNQPKGP